MKIDLNDPVIQGLVKELLSELSSLAGRHVNCSILRKILMRLAKNAVPAAITIGIMNVILPPIISAYKCAEQGNFQ